MSWLCGYEYNKASYPQTSYKANRSINEKYTP